MSNKNCASAIISTNHDLSDAILTPVAVVCNESLAAWRGMRVACAWRACGVRARSADFVLRLMLACITRSADDDAERDNEGKS